MGGDPTGIVSGIQWTSCGGDRAEGQGTTIYLDVAAGQRTADGSQETATVVAFEPGQCGGHAAYTSIAWYFPQHGETLDTALTFNACTGD